jgi:hypothetical protein
MIHTTHWVPSSKNPAIKSGAPNISISYFLIGMRKIEEKSLKLNPLPSSTVHEIATIGIIKFVFMILK